MSDDKINDLNEYKKKKEDAKMQEAAINKVANLLQEEADQDSAFFCTGKVRLKKQAHNIF